MTQATDEDEQMLRVYDTDRICEDKAEDRLAEL